VCVCIQFIVAVNTKSERAVPANGAQQHGACSELSTHVRDYNNWGDVEATKKKTWITRTRERTLQIPLQEESEITPIRG